MKTIEIKMGKFSYQAGGTTHKGEFNVYQARHGGIMLLMGTAAICLTQQQVNDLAVDCYGLADFDIDAYKNFYEKENQSPSHYFYPSRENNRFCECGRYLTDDCHRRADVKKELTKKIEP